MVNVYECVATGQVDPLKWSQHAILHLNIATAQKKQKRTITAQATEETFARVFVVHVRRIAQVLLLLVYWLLQLSSSELNNYYHSASFVVREKFPYL